LLHSLQENCEDQLSDRTALTGKAAHTRNFNFLSRLDPSRVWADTVSVAC
jgi:hypothetical protein